MRAIRTFRAALRRPTAVAAILLLAITAGACGPTASDGPDAVVREALGMVAAKDVDGLRTLACAGQEDLIREQLGLPSALGGELLPGLDLQGLVDAVRLDVTGLSTGEPSIDGDVAQVPVSGDLKVTFDAAAMKPILRQVMEQQGTTLTDEQLDALLGTLEAYGQDVPLDTSVRLIRENGDWRICQDTVPAAPSP